MVGWIESELAVMQTDNISIFSASSKPRCQWSLG
jgi:hypothetical protein